MRFRPPAPQPGAIRRERVSAALTEAAGDALTVVSAPSGFGKTTAVADWASSLEHVGWLGLSTFDSDPSRLTQGVVNALLVGTARSGHRTASISTATWMTPIRRIRRSAGLWKVCLAEFT